MGLHILPMALLNMLGKLGYAHDLSTLVVE
jgi:hypothetical protein